MAIQIIEKSLARFFIFGKGGGVVVIEHVGLKKLPESLDQIQIGRVGRKINELNLELFGERLN